MDGFDRGPIFDDFLSEQKIKQIWKKEAESAQKDVRTIWSAAEVGPVEAFGVWELADLQNTEFGSTRRRGGAADLWATASSADLPQKEML